MVAATQASILNALNPSENRISFTEPFHGSVIIIG